MARHKRRLSFLLLTLISLDTHAKEVEGIPFADGIDIDKNHLILNGVGVRTATLFKVKVYAAGLYTVSKESSAEKLLESFKTSAVEMSFFRDITASDINAAWDHSFQKNCTADCGGLKEPIEKLKGLTPSVVEKDRMRYVMTPDSASLELNGKALGKIESKGFGRALLATWIGKEPPTERLREGLLGKSE